MGKLGKILHVLNSHQPTLDTAIGNVAAQYASTLRDAYGQLAAAQLGMVRSQTGIMGQVQTLARATVLGMVEADSPAAARSLEDALFEVRRQMLASGDSVPACTVAATIAALGTPAGTGNRVVSTKRGDGLVQQNLFAEVGRLVCTADSHSGGATAGREQFEYVGESNQTAGVYDYDWPVGTDARTSLSAVSADEDASASGNLLTNGDMETWDTAGTPTLNGQNWVTTGTAGTDFARNATTPFRGTYDFKFLAGTGANTALAQTFNDSSTGTGANPLPLTSYAFNAWMRRDGAVSAGVLTVDLVDATNTVIADARGVNNSFATTLSTLATTFGAISGVFRLPAAPPSTVKLRIRMSTALAGANVYLDDVCLARLTPLYTGGPGLAVFSGVTPFVTGDTHTVTQTNDRASATFLATWQALFDRLFSSRGIGPGFLLPSSGSPTILDTLITA